MAKESKSMGMQKFKMGHWEKDQGQLKVGDNKYGTQFGNPDDMKKNNDALVAYAKKHKEKY